MIVAVVVAATQMGKLVKPHPSCIRLQQPRHSPSLPAFGFMFGRFRNQRTESGGRDG